MNDDWLQRIYYTCQRKTSSSRTDGSASDSGGVDNSKPADLSETSGGDDGNLFAGEKSVSIKRDTPCVMLVSSHPWPQLKGLEV